MAKVRQCLGIDIGTHSIRIAEVSLGASTIQIRKLAEARVELEPGQTEVQRQAAIAARINQILKDEKIKTRNAVFCMPGQTVFVRQLKVPSTTPERLHRIIQYEAREQIPFPLDKTHLEYQVFEGDNPAEVEVLLVAIRNDHVDSFMKLVRKTGLRPLSISVSSLALHNFYEVNRGPKNLLERIKGETGAKKPKKKKKGKKGEPEEEEEQEDLGGMEFEEIMAEVNLGATMMDLAIPKAGANRLIGFTRTVPLAGSQIDRAIRTRCGLATLEEAVRVKEEETAILSSDYELSGDVDEINMTASQAATAVVDQLIAEIRRSLDFFISQPDGVAVDGIVLSGGLSRMRFLVNYIEEKMGLPVELATIKNDKLEAPEEGAGELASYVIPIGLALQGLGVAQSSIDFLPQEVKNVRAFAESRGQLIGAGVMLALSVFLALSSGSKYMQQNSELSAKYDDTIQRSSTLTKQISDAEADNKLAASKFQSVVRIQGNRDYWFNFSIAFLKARPPEVLIEKLEMTNDGNVMVTGLAAQQISINKFLDALNANRALVKKAEIANLSAPFVSPIFPVSTGTVRRFTIRVQTLVRQGRYRPLKEPAALPGASTAAAQGGPAAPSAGAFANAFSFKPGGK